MICEFPLETALSFCRVTVKANTAFASINNIAFVLIGRSEDPRRLKSPIIIERERGKDMIRIPTQRKPTHPGEMLLEEFLAPMQMTQRELADAIHVPYQRVNEIVHLRRGVTPSTALRLSKFFGTTPDFWMNLQLRWDLYHAQDTERAALSSIHPRTHPAE